MIPKRADFLMTYPCYVLAEHYTLDPELGLRFDKGFQVNAPDNGDGEKQVAIFTDSHLVEEYREQCELTHLDILAFETPGALKTLLQWIFPACRLVWIDLNHKTGKGRTFLIAELILQLEDDPH